MKRIRIIVDKVLEFALIILMAAMVINVLWQVFTRFILNDPSSYTEELARFLLIWVGLLGASYAAGKKMHLAIDILKMKLSQRIRHYVELFIQSSIFLFALLVMVTGGLRLVHLTFTMGQISAALQIPIGYVYLVLPLSGILIMFYAALSLEEEIQENFLAGRRSRKPNATPDN